MYLAGEYLEGDILMLHGDLVFNKELVSKVLANENPSVCLYNEDKKLPEKDFKGRFEGNVLKEVSINIFDNDCYAFQPLYKLCAADLTSWKNEVERFISEGKNNVYAENALNNITDRVSIIGMFYRDDYIDEIDTEEDYLRVSKEIQVFYNVK